MKKFIAAFLLTTALQTGAAQAGTFERLGDLPGMFSSQVYGLTADGKYIVGTSGDGAEFEAFLWHNGVMVGIGDLPGGTNNSTARGVSADGKTIVGRGNGVNGTEAFIWREGIGMVGLGDLPGGSFSSQALAVSADGTVVAGTGSVAGFYPEIWRWTQSTNMVSIGFLPGSTGGMMAFGGMTADGNTIVGQATNASGFSEAFRWINGTGMIGMGDLSGGAFNSGANGTNRDGSVIVGWATSALGQEAFRWTQTTGMVGLGDLPGGSYNSTAFSTNYDGTIIIGRGNTANGTEAFYWSETDGMRLLTDVMTEAGADLTGWTVINPMSLNDDGSIMIARGQYGGTTVAFVMNFNDAAIINTVDLGKSLNTVAQAGQQSSIVAMNYMPQGLFVAQNLATVSTPVQTSSSFYVASSSPYDLQDITPAAGGKYIAGGGSGLSFFMLGSFGVGQNNDFNNDQYSGTAGLSFRVADGLDLGIGVIGGASNMELDFKGESRMDAVGGLTFLSYAPYETGFRLYATAYAAKLSLDIERGYFNGTTPDRSNGETDGVSYGGALKLGWKENVSEDTSVMPYVEGRYGETKIDGYSEKGGSFAAKFSEQNSDYATSRLGLEITHKLNDKVDLMLRPAWAHRLSDDGGTFSADLNGLAQTLGSASGDRDWAELSVGATWKATDNAVFSMEVMGRTGDTAEPAANVIIGTTIKF